MTSSIKNITKTLLVICLLTLSACTWLSNSSVTLTSPNEALIATSSGIVQGLQNASSEQQVIAWYDIPYAQPPVGELRWKAPRSLLSPDQVITDKQFNACVQKASRYAGAEGEGIVGTEDCLYLDIKAPSDFADKQYPVMFWIHGGANTTGLKDYYDFSALVESQNVIVVTINYRLGALGWFTHPAIQGSQTGLDKTSNFGLLDIIQALKWVNQNIAKFGGNPDNITVFGESAGGHNVLALLASPLSEGLFHRAISQSGYTTSVNPTEALNQYDADPLIKRGAWQITNLVLDQPQEQLPLSSVRQRLMEIDAREFIGLYYRDQERPAFDKIPLTTNDGIVIPKKGLLESLADPDIAKQVPVIAGATKDEISLWLALHRYFVESHYPLTKLFPPTYNLRNPQLYDFWVRIRSHAWKFKGVDSVLSALHNAGYSDLYAYRFDWDHQKSSLFIDFPAFFGAAHGTDIAFVTGNFTYGPITSYIYPEGSEREQMKRTFMGAWSSFAESGNPSYKQNFDWQPYLPENPVYMHLDIDTNLRQSLEKASIYTLLDEVAKSPIPSELERCHIVWEIHTNVGINDVQGYRDWDDGRCKNVDIPAAQNALADQLIAKYGSVEIL